MDCQVIRNAIWSYVVARTGHSPFQNVALSLLQTKCHCQRRSTCTNLLECINDWTLILQDGNSVTVVYIDFNKAFDSVAHDKLFARFSQYGIKSNLLEWLKNFFKNRTHRTKVGYKKTYIVFHRRVDEWGSTGQWNRSNRISHFS